MRPTLGRPAAIPLFVLAGAVSWGCGSSLEGTYADPAGEATLELKADNQAAFTVLGDTQTCTYAREPATLTLTCPGQQTFAFSIGAEGALTSDAAGIGPLRKVK